MVVQLLQLNIPLLFVRVCYDSDKTIKAVTNSKNSQKIFYGLQKYVDPPITKICALLPLMKLKMGKSSIDPFLIMCPLFIFSV
jgi:hypothetical protein